MSKSKAKAKSLDKYACTHNKKLQHVFTIEKCEVWAGGCHDVAEYASKLDLLISVGGSSTYNSAISPRRKYSSIDYKNGSKQFFKLPEPKDSDHKNAPALVIEWPDMSTPELDGDWWEAFAKGLSKFEGKVGIFCFGGHGRTGTTLALLAYLFGIDNEDPVAWVRKNYCMHTVETSSQIEYIKSFGIPTTEPPCKASYGGSNMGISSWSNKGTYSDPVHKGGLNTPLNLDDDEWAALLKSTGPCQHCGTEESKYDENTDDYDCGTCEFTA